MVPFLQDIGHEILALEYLTQLGFPISGTTTAVPYLRRR
jgi:hypothetical protein